MADLEAQLERVHAAMQRRPEGLRAHAARVAGEAVDLARYWQVDPVRVALAAWGHDLFRAHNPAELLNLAGDLGIRPAEADLRDPVLLHGPVAAIVMKEQLGVRDTEVLLAVKEHTFGGAQMSMVSKILLIADKVEERKRKRAPAMKGIRQLARRDLDLALLCWADWKWVEEVEHEWHSHPIHWRARVAWVAERHADIGMPGRVGTREFNEAVKAAG